MPKFKKRPVVIEAEQYNGTEASIVKILALVDGPADAVIARVGHLLIRTLEGDMRADPGDWIIKGIKGELYPCKPDIFAQTYDKE